MKQNNSFSPIGIFDSGLGGLSILNEIEQRLPNEELIYFADSKNAPYGEKSRQEIIEISRRNAEFLIARGCKLIVVACNTATTNAINILRDTYNVPIVGIEPAIKPAALYSQNKSVGVLATKGTLSSELFMKTAEKFTKHTHLVEVIGMGIVEAIESDTTNSIEFHKVLKEQLLPFKKANVDTLVLGCSHYPFITPHIQRILGDDVNIIDSGFAVARQTERILEKLELNNTEGDSAIKPITIYTNGTSNRALKTVLNQLVIQNYKSIDVVDQ